MTPNNVNPGEILTIVLPTYNGAETLAETLASINGQTNQNFQLIVIDDGSSDGTIEMLKGSITRTRDRLILKNNSGLYDTLNRAVAEVQSDWVSFIFQDDRLKPKYVQECLGLIGEPISAELVWFAIDTIDANSNIVDRGLSCGRREFISPGKEPWREGLMRGTYWTISGSLTRAECLRCMPFRPDFPHCADYDFLLRALRHYTLLYVETPLVEIRQHANQASATNLLQARDIDERLRVLGEALGQYPQDVDAELRMRIVLRMLLQISRRAAGNLRRGRFRNRWDAWGMLLRALHLAIPVR